MFDSSVMSIPESRLGLRIAPSRLEKLKPPLGMSTLARAVFFVKKTRDEKTLDIVIFRILRLL